MRTIPRRVWIFTAVLVTVASVPYLVGYLNAPPGGAFTGDAVHTTIVDFYSHLAKMQIGLRGEWLYRILFTSDEHPGLLIQTFYVALGHLARVMGASPVLVYHLARVVFTAAMAVTIWLFVARFLADDRTRWTAFLLATITGGLGWALYFLAPAQTAQISPIEFWLLDAYTFLCALTFPHFPAVVAGLLAFFLAADRWLRVPGWRPIPLLTLLGLLVGWIQPFDMLLTALVLAALTGWAVARGAMRRAQALMLMPVAGVHLLVVGYHYLAMTSHPVWDAFNAQNITLSPPPLYYLFGYFWLLVPAVVGLIHAWRKREARLLLPVVWVGLTAALVYAPLQMQRRFLMGVQVPLAVLAAAGLAQIDRWWLKQGWSPRWWGQVWLAGLLLSAATHVALLTMTIRTANPEDRPALYLTADDLAALDWLRDQPPDTVILGAFSTGGKAAAYTGRRTYLGHWYETGDYQGRKARVQAFFQPAGMTDAERLRLLEEAGINYIWHDDAARALGDWSPDAAAFLRLVFHSGAVAVYEVRP